VTTEFTDAELEAYLDESLDSTRAAEVEQSLRDDQELLQRLSRINGRRDAGIHTLGEIWRRHQVAVPTVETMQNHLMGVLTTEESDYIEFRMNELKCPFTIAMQKDLQAQQSENAELSKTRREKFYKTSAGLLKKNEPE
jgi:REP element-mobilizing transposase RayT